MIKLNNFVEDFAFFVTKQNSVCDDMLLHFN